MILILGSNGLLGSYFKKYLKNKNIKFLTIGRKKCDFNGDILDNKFLRLCIKKTNPTCVINFAAYTNVENCEKNTILAAKLNIELPKKISLLINSNVHFVHFSTDHIYNGIGPHKESNKIKSINKYAQTKLQGEKNIKHKKKCILRTNFFGKSIISNRHSFTDWIYNNMKKKNKIDLFHDVYFSPISMESLSKCLLIILQKKIIGTYNLGSNNGMSKKIFALNFLKKIKFKNIKYKSVSLNESMLKVNRPKDMRMDCKKIEKKLGFKMNNLIDEINLAAKDY